jgi:hypothetical protein
MIGLREALALLLIWTHPGPPPGDGFGDFAAVREALGRVFGGGDYIRVAYQPVVLDSAARAAVARSSRSPFADDTLRIYVCHRGAALAGYGIVDNVKGKSRDITYMLALGPDGAVASLEILVYRESHGGEVAAPAFRGQFRGKKAGDRLAAGRDIQLISGATISSRSVTAGAAKLLAAFDLVRERSGR